MKPNLNISLIHRAIFAAEQSKCRKSKRGVVLFSSPRSPLEITYSWTGFNRPPFPLKCTEECEADGRCGKTAIHAEMDALDDFFGEEDREDLPRLRHLEGLHVKVDEDGKLLTSGGPSCVDCSKHLLDVGLKAFWLFHKNGFLTKGRKTEALIVDDYITGFFARYDIREFHEISLRANGLPVLT